MEIINITPSTERLTPEVAVTLTPSQAEAVAAGRINHLFNAGAWEHAGHYTLTDNEATLVSFADGSIGVCAPRDLAHALAALDFQSV